MSSKYAVLDERLIETVSSIFSIPSTQWTENEYKRVVMAMEAMRTIASQSKHEKNPATTAGGDLKREISEAICELNTWRVPLRLNGLLLPNNGDEGMTVAMNILTNFVPFEEWIKVWREYHGSKDPCGPDNFTDESVNPVKNDK